MSARLCLVLGSGSARGWAHIGVMDFHRADEAIAEGREAVKRMLPAIQSVLPR